MENQVSPQERLDILFNLAMAFSVSVAPNYTDNALRILAALNSEDVKLLRKRAQWFEQITPAHQKDWRKYVLERVRLRGLPLRLDENVHPSLIADVLRNEPFVIQGLILRYLPPEIAVIVGEMLEISGFLTEYWENLMQRDDGLPSEKIIRVIRQEFLSSFTSFEEIYEPTALDRLSGKQLEHTIWLLGVRETAMACRGIATKENLAVFLSRFNQQNAREVVSQMSLLTEIEPRRVVQADNIVRETLLEILEPEEMTVQVGLKLLAITLAQSEKVRWLYSEQKLPFSVAAELRIELEKAQEIWQDETQTEWLETVGREVETLAAKLISEI